MKAKVAFFDGISQLIAGARTTVARGVDLVQVHTNFEIGRRIVQEEQRGKDRAAYGEQVIGELAERLTAEFGRGFSDTNLKLMRLFYLQNQNRIRQSVTDQSGTPAIGQTVSDQFNPPSIRQSLTGILGPPPPRPFTSRAQGASSTMKKIGKPVVQNMPVPNPSLAQQKSTIAELDLLETETQRLEAIYRQKHAALDALKKSLLDRAFTGLL